MRVLVVYDTVYGRIGLYPRRESVSAQAARSFDRSVLSLAEVLRTGFGQLARAQKT